MVTLLQGLQAKGKLKRTRNSYHGSNLDSAVKEANSLLDTLAHDRLDNCRYKPSVKTSEADSDDDVEEDEEEEQPDEGSEMKRS